MKKWLSLILVLVLALVLVGCGDDPDDPNPTPDNPVVEDVKPTKIEISGQKEEIEVGEEFTITVVVSPDNATNKAVRYSSSDSSVATVKDGKVTGISAGGATITVTASGDTKVTASFTVTVKGDGEEEPEPVIIPPTEFVINGKTEVEVGKSINLAIAAQPEGAKRDATWSSNNEAVATVINGVVTGVSVGTVTIVAVSTIDTNVSASYEITVIEEKEVVIIQPESISVYASETEIYEGSKLTLLATVYPAGAEQTVRWESRNPDIATIDSTGRITAIKEGIAYFTAYSTVDENIKSNRVKIRVLKDEEASIPKPDLQGYEIVLMHNTKIDPYGEDYSSISMLYEQRAWTEVQQEYNCVLVDLKFPDEATWGPNRNQWILDQAAVGQAQADLYQLPIGWLGVVVGGNAIAPVDAYYAKWGKNQMASIQKVGSTVGGSLYGISQGAETTKVYADLGIYYNVGMLEKYNIENPSKLFNEGKWNYSEFTRWVESSQALLPEGVYVLSGHPYYYWIGMIAAAGAKISDAITLEINLTGDIQTNAAELLRTLKLKETIYPVSEWMESSGAFFDQKALCSSGFLWFCKSSTRWMSDVWGEDTRFGYVPFPWPDQYSKKATRVKVGTDEVVWTIATQRQRPTYVTEEDLYRVMVDYFYRTKKYQQADPTFDAELIRRQTLEKKLDDPESIEAMLYFTFDKTVVELADAIYESISGSPFHSRIGSVVMNGDDYVTKMGEILSVFEQKFLGIFAVG